MIFISQFTFPKLVLKKKLKKKLKLKKKFFALSDPNLRDIQKKFWALSFIAVVIFVEFAVSENMTPPFRASTPLLEIFSFFLIWY